MSGPRFQERNATGRDRLGGRFGSYAHFGVAAVIFVSIALMVIAAGRGDITATGMIALLTGTGFVIIGLAIGGLGGLSDRVQLAARLSELTGAAYTWGSLAIACMYFMTDLSWHHAWQYPIYFAIPAAFCFWIGRSLGGFDAERQAAWIKRLRFGSLFQFALGLATVVFLLQSGKLGQARADWAANIVFFRGALVLVELSLLGLILDWLGRRGGVRD